MFAFLTTVFVTSLTGSLHCAGMCGPFAMMAGICTSGGECEQAAGSNRRVNLTAMAGYHSGRFITYMLIGAVAGLVGATVDLGGRLAGFQQVATISAGIAMVGFGGLALMRQAGFVRGSSVGPAWLPRLLQPWIRQAVQLKGGARGLGIGLLTCLMPCGWLYVFAITAAGTASPLWGAVTMMVFWAGTVPVLLTMVAGAGSLLSGRKWNLPAVTASLVMLLGVYTILFRAPINLADSTPVSVSGSVSEAAMRLEQVDQQKLPCCQNH